MTEEDDNFKRVTLADICRYKDKVQRFLDETFASAENAAENLKYLYSNQSDPDFIKNLVEMNTLLKDCREKLVVIANVIPDVVTEPSRQPIRQPLDCSAANLHVPKMNVDYNKPYLVKLLLPGSPSRFWLNLETTSTDKIEEDLRTAYVNTECIKSLPSLGSFVVCLMESGKYCRGKVVTILEYNSANPEVDIVLVDYGGTVTTSIGKLYPIQSKFCTEPAHGMLCSLYELEPLDGSWDFQTMVFFMDQCKNNWTAIFHKMSNPASDAPFSKFSPDFYVSLLRRDCEETNSDLRTIMVNRGMAKFSGQPPGQRNPSQKLPGDPSNRSPLQSQESRHTSSNQRLVSSTPGTDLSKKQSEERNEHEVTVSPSAVLSLASNDLSLEVVKLQKLVLSKSEELSPLEKRNQQESQGRKPKVVLNTNAREFIPRLNSPSSFVENQSQIKNKLPPSDGFTQEENAQNTTISSSAETGISSGAKKKGPQIRAIPNHLVKNSVNSSSVTIGTTQEDEIDALLRPPNTGIHCTSHDDSVDHSSFCHETIRKRTDPQLMEQFLDSVNIASPIHRQPFDNSDGDTRSYDAAISQFRYSEKHWATYESSRPRKDVPKSSLRLEYQYGAVLETRPLPIIQDQTTPMKCSLSYVASPSHFYIHLCDEISNLVDPLFDSLNSLYQNSPEVPVTQPEIGSFWVIQESCTKYWSRAKVLSISTDRDIGWNTGDESKRKVESPTRVKVFFVDWGFEDVVEVSKLRPLVKEILGAPCLAIRCRLDGIFPFGKSVNSKEWAAQANEKFIELTGFEKELTALADLNLDEDGALPLLMFQNDDDKKYSVNELLVHLGFASSHVFKAAKTPELDDEDWDDPDWDPMNEDYYSSKNTPTLNTENYDSVTTGYIPQDEVKICRFFRASGSCYKGIKCDLLHSKAPENVSTQDQVEVYVKVPSLPALVSGSLVSLQVTCVINAYRFHAILPHGTNNLRYAFDREDEYETLESMQEALQEEYSTNYYLHRVSIAPLPGDVVIARSPEDNNWYRGRVVEGGNDLFGIYFLDYGNAQLVHLRDICKFIPRFVHFPAQAIEMSLNGIDASEENETEKARETFASLVENRDLVARIVHVMPFVCVDLYDTSGTTEINIVDEMVRRGVALPVKKKDFCLLRDNVHGHVIAG